MKKTEAIEEARELVAHYGPMLGLDNWVVHVVYDKLLPDGTIAETDPIEGRHCAVLTIGPMYRRCNEWERRQTIIHELLHCVHHRLTEQTRLLGAASCGSQKGYDTLWAGVRNEAEFMVDSLSMALVDYLPLH